jgi:hypothetical protein
VSVASVDQYQYLTLSGEAAIKSAAALRVTLPSMKVSLLLQGGSDLGLRFCLSRPAEGSTMCFACLSATVCALVVLFSSC